MNVMTDLKKNKLMCEDSLSVLADLACGVSDLLHIGLYVDKATGKTLPKSYSAELRSFALTLHFYSPHAYHYVRKRFNTCLLHPRTIERWFESVDGKPGFTSKAFRALEMRATEATSIGKKIVCPDDG